MEEFITKFKEFLILSLYILFYKIELIMIIIFGNMGIFFYKV